MEYISKQSLLSDLNEATPRSYFAFETMVREYPTEDVVPVVHAHWIFYANGTCDCSNCHTVWETNMLNRWIEYCPFCGAIMDEVVE